MSITKKSVLGLFLGMAIAAAALQLGRGPIQSASPVQHASAAAPTTIHLPLLLKPPTVLNIQQLTASVSDAKGNSRTAYLPGETIRYSISGTNQSSITGTVQLSWSQASSCATEQVFKGTLNLPLGPWAHVITSTLSTCLGVTTHTAALTNAFVVDMRTTRTVTNPPSVVAVDTRQGFDRCRLPTLAEMQAWWNSSPYAVHNLYLGGVSFYCDDNPLDAFWVQEAAKQGWSFILAWVGPQAPCSGYEHRMDSNAATAYQEGRSEASSAAAAATRLGFLGDHIIYYDLEYYTNATTVCRATVKSFIQGWTDKLHQLGFQAGAYGSPCTSYIADWATNSPPPDDIWIARWKTPAVYDPDVTVWGGVCGLTDAMWSSHQRIRQYAGDHYETWGGVRLGIDSNVLDGEITVIPISGSSAAAPTASTFASGLAPLVRDFDLLTVQAGWALVENRLLWSADGGQSWQEIPLTQGTPSEILDVHFATLQAGWVVRRAAAQDGQESLSVLRTEDGGASWQAAALPEAGSHPGLPAAAAYLDFLDSRTGWLALKLQSGSSFSLGRLYFTQDGGLTWQERSLPLGEPVQFIDSQRGWVSGGPAGDLSFATSDGGLTWQPQVSAGINPTLKGELPDLDGVVASSFATPQAGWALVQRDTCQGTKTRLGEALPAGAQPLSCTLRSILYKTEDGGLTWAEIRLPQP